MFAIPTVSSTIITTTSSSVAGASLIDKAFIDNPSENTSPLPSDFSNTVTGCTRPVFPFLGLHILKLHLDLLLALLHLNLSCSGGT